MTEDQNPELLEWTVHPFAESRPKAVVAVIAPLLVAIVFYFWTASWFWTMLSFLLIVSSVFPFYIRARFRFDDKGVTVVRGGVKTCKGWDTINSHYPDRNGVLLSPFLRPFWLENFRGIYVLYGRHRTEVMQYLEQKFSSDLNK